jgi:ADP-ribosyltransferase exoenzyme
MNASEFYNENLEKDMLEIIKFFYKFYANKITDVQRKAIFEYRNMYHINIFLLGKDESLKDLLYGHTSEKSQVFENILKHKLKLVFFINELDNIFRIIPKYNKKIVTYRGLHICNRYPVEPNLKNMIYELERSNIGKEFMFSTFLSTSLDPYTAFYNFANPKWKSNKNSNKKYVNKLQTTCDDLFELFGKKYFLLMKINIPKGNKFLYLDIFPLYIFPLYEDSVKNKIEIEENEILLPRNSILKLVKRYDLTMKMRKPKEYSANNILKNKVKHENLPTRIYELDYVGYEDTKQKIDFDVDLVFNQNKTYLKKIMKEVENEMKKS